MLKVHRITVNTNRMYAIHRSNDKNLCTALKAKNLNQTEVFRNGCIFEVFYSNTDTFESLFYY